LNIYHVGITVDYNKKWKIKNQFAYSIKNLKESLYKNYYTDGYSTYIFKFDIDQGVIVHSGIDEEQDDFTTYHIYLSYKDNETVNVDDLKKQVQDYYQNELYKIINECQKTIDKFI
jgi:hypothetical protein